MLDDTLKTQLQSHLERINRPIAIQAWVDQSQTSQEMMELISEIAQLSASIQLTLAEDATQISPSFSLSSPGQAIDVRFAGLPMGHEFTSLILALLQVGGVAAKISDETRAQIAQLKGDYRFETFFSQSCQNCPEVVQALNTLAVLNPAIHHTAIDGASFQDLVNERQVMALPSVFLNGALFSNGRMSVEQLLQKLDSNASSHAKERLNAKPIYDILVVGAGPAGAAAAIYAARKGIRTGIVAERFGGQIVDTLSIENFISISHTEGPKMATALESHVRETGADVIHPAQVEQLLPADQSGILGLVLQNGATLKSRSLILAPGARWREMNVPGEAMYRNKGVAFCPHCDGPLYKGKRVAVIGGGNSGVEAAIDLAGLVQHVTLVEFCPSLRADAVLVEKLRHLANVSVLTHVSTTQVNGDGKKVTGLTYQDRTTQAHHLLAVDGIFVQIGLVPNTHWLKETVACTDRGEIMIDERGQTSLAGVFAAGDATTVAYKQIIIAMGEGAKAALSAFDALIRQTHPAKAHAA